MTIPASTIQSAIDDLAWTRDRWDDLVEYRLKGTPRPWHQPSDLTPEKRSERDALARLERTEVERWGRAPGFSPAPLHVSTLDVMVDILAEADALHETIAQYLGHDRLDSATSALDDPSRFLTYAEALTPAAAAESEQLFDLIAEKAAQMRSAIAAELGEIEDGHTLNAICPFCVGVTPRHPAGGAKTMRIRLVDDRLNPGHREAVIVCESGTCKPFAAECSLWVRDRPAWRFPEWDWLAERLLPAA